jgi:hypothetical protein
MHAAAKTKGKAEIKGREEKTAVIILKTRTENGGR